MDRRNEYQRELGRKTGTPRDALAPYPWSGSGNWCPAEAKETEVNAAIYASWLGKDFRLLNKCSLVFCVAYRLCVCVLYNRSL